MTAILAEFSDPRLVAIYDAINPYNPETQPRFYMQLAAGLGSASIVDLGCGTGLITCKLAGRGHRMTGVDPSPAMVAIARRRPYGDRVHWIVGHAHEAGTPCADLAIMTGHVAQFFLTDEAWHEALTALHAALRPGGRLAFESRNPDAREWESWTPAARRSVDDPASGRIDTWAEVEDVRGGIVSYSLHYAFATSGQVLVAPTRLRFRTHDELTASLAEAGFAVDRVHGDWDLRPAGPTTPELIVVASR